MNEFQYYNTFSLGVYDSISSGRLSVISLLEAIISFKIMLYTKLDVIRIQFPSYQYQEQITTTNKYPYLKF